MPHLTLSQTHYLKTYQLYDMFNLLVCPTCETLHCGGRMKNFLIHSWSLDGERTREREKTISDFFRPIGRASGQASIMQGKVAQMPCCRSDGVPNFLRLALNKNSWFVSAAWGMRKYDVCIGKEREGLQKEALFGSSLEELIICPQGMFLRKSQILTDLTKVWPLGCLGYAF